MLGDVLGDVYMHAYVSLHPAIQCQCANRRDGFSRGEVRAAKMADIKWDAETAEAANWMTKAAVSRV